MSSFESIRKLTAEISGVDQETITLETNLRETLDSLELAELDIAIDEEFQIEVDGDNYAAAKTIGDLVRIVDGALIAKGEYCPICAVKFKSDDRCATDIQEGTCHAECLEGSPVVDLDTSEPIPDGKLGTYRYSDVQETEGHANG